MYGYSGYGTNSYGTARPSNVTRIVKLGGRVFTGIWNAAVTFMRRSSARTFQDPQNQSQTFQLPPT